MDESITAKGMNGQITLAGHRVIISRKGLGAAFTQGFRGEKEILLSSITAIQMKKAGPLFNGFIQFSFGGGSETKKGLTDAVKDENTVMFRTGKQQEEFLRLKMAIDRERDALTRASVASSHGPSGIGEIERLADLFERGLLTEKEYRRAKQKALGLE